MSSYLLPISDRDALVWIVREQRTAFAEHRAREAQRIEVGDELLLYATRGCFGNPTRDRGRIIGRATVTTAAERLKTPVSFGSRAFPYLVRFELEELTRAREGVELEPLTPRLKDTFPDPQTWGIRLRRALVPLSDRDATRIKGELAKISESYGNASKTYATQGRRHPKEAVG